MRTFIAAVAALHAGPGVAQSYEDLSACEKEAVLWKQIEASEYERLPQWSGLEPAYLVLLALTPISSIARDFLRVSMERESDEMPEGRFKHIHTYGSVARISFLPEGEHGFTGLFAGAECGLVRLALAAKPEFNGNAPGLAAKLFIDGKPSGNLLTLVSLDGQDGFDFFKNEQSNFVAPPKNPVLVLIEKGFALVAKDPARVDVESLARVNSHGSTSAQPHGPEQIFLIPNREDLRFSDESHEVRNDFARIPAGTTLYTVYGRSRGETERIRIGSIVTKSRFVASKYGDAKLFFRHERYQGD